MTTIINGSSPSITFSDSTTQSSGVNTTNPVFTGDATISGLTVGKGGGAVSTNTAVGASALAANTSGSNNVALGYRALSSMTTGNTCVAIGQDALKTSVAGTENTAVGFQSMLSTLTASANSALGLNSLSNNTTGNNNTAVGYTALQSNTTASNNTALGYQAGYSATTGGGNTFVGYLAGYSSNAANSSNQFFGYRAGKDITTGVSNTILGGYNGNQGGLDIRTSSNNIVLSDGDGNPQVSIESNAKMTIGASGFNGGIRMPSTGGIIYIASVTSNSQFQISYNSTGAGVALGSGATSWSTFSDERLKNVTGTYTNALEDIAQIQPVKFTWKNDTENKPQVGVIAQSVQNVVPEAIDSTTYEMDGDAEYLQVRYTELIPLMIASIQELKTIVDAQAAEIAELKAKVGI